MKKKKYAALAVDNYNEAATGIASEKTHLEVKGLDMVRRDWSHLTWNVCEKVLNILMNSGDLG